MESGKPACAGRGDGFDVGGKLSTTRKNHSKRFWPFGAGDPRKLPLLKPVINLRLGSPRQAFRSLVGTAIRAANHSTDRLTPEHGSKLPCLRETARS